MDPCTHIYSNILSYSASEREREMHTFGHKTALYHYSLFCHFTSPDLMVERETENAVFLVHGATNQPTNIIEEYLSSRYTK